MIRRTPFVALALAGAAACQTQLPEISPEAFACESDEPLSDGSFDCPESHRCAGQRCVSRLDCTDPSSSKERCERGVTRCDLFRTEQTLAVGCASGIHTLTSSVPKNGTCDCPEATLCTARADGPSGLPLFLAFGSEPVPVGRLGITGEVARARVCARPCSSELDCPSNHTCRPATLAASRPPSATASPRRTVAVCYPDRIATLTSTDTAQPEPMHCTSQGECGAEGGGKICRVEPVQIADHPIAPIGKPWGERTALIARCDTRQGVGLIPVGDGCLAGAQCLTGICYSQRCVELCDRTMLPNICAGGDTCSAVQVERERPGDRPPVRDRIDICVDIN